MYSGLFVQNSPNKLQTHKCNAVKLFVKPTHIHTFSRYWLFKYKL